jgi:peptide/nickel transport system substrate-binding protein
MKKLIVTFLSTLIALTILAGCAQAPTTTVPATQAPASVTQAPAKTQAPVETKAPVAKDAVFFGGWPYNTPPTGHFNMFVVNAIELKYFRELFQLPLATYLKATDVYEPLLAASWKIDQANNTFQVTLRNDAMWRSGEKFTAKDVWTTFAIYRLLKNPVWDYVDSVKIVSDYEVLFTVKTPTPLILRYVLRKPMVDYKTYGEFADKVQALVDAGKDSKSTEWQTLSTAFNAFRPTYVNATGPYYLDPANVTESSIELRFNEKSYLASKVNFGKVVVYNGDVAALTPLVLNGEVDFLTHQFPATSMDTFSGMGYTIMQVDGVDGIAIYFNELVAPLAIKEVRQAIAYVIDRNRVGELALPGVTRGTQFITGLGDEMAAQWMDTSKLIKYPVDLKKAAELLTSAGMTQKDGQWYLKDGKQFTLSLQCPSAWSDGSTAATEMSSQLSAFGIKTTFEGIDSTMRQSNLNDGKYEMALSFFGTGQPHPMFAYETPLLVTNIRTTKGLSYPMIQQTARFGTVDLEKEIVASTAGWDLVAQKAAVEKIAATVNETLPYLPIYTKYSKYVSSQGLRTIWGADKSIYKNSAGDDSFVVIQILHGDLKPIK